MLMLPQGHAKQFSLDGYEFIKSTNQPSHGCRYIVRFDLDGNGWSDITTKFNGAMTSLEDALAFYYSMPFIWEWWAFTMQKGADTENRILVSLYKEIPGVPMESYNEMPTEAIMNLANAAKSDSKLADALYYYNSLCRLDISEYSRAHLPVIFQLIDSVAQQETAKGCQHCGRQDYKRTSRDDVKAILGSALYRDLYINLEDGELTARNATMHGASNASSLSQITVGHIEEVLVKVRKRLVEKYGLKDIEEASGRVDVARYFFDREGTRIAVGTIPDATIDDYYSEFISNDLHGFKMKQIDANW
jgi:hypothetical protein